MSRFRAYPVLLGGLLVGILTMLAAGAQAAAEPLSGAHGTGTVLLAIAVLLLAAKGSSLIERMGQPAVLGELLAGVVLGNLALVGIPWFRSLAEGPVVQFLAELGAVVLLFQIGLESNLAQLRAVGPRALLVACVGVAFPFLLGTYLVGPWLFPSLPTHSYLFLGAALTATSVGITARVFRDLRKLHLPEAQIVLGAAVIDDVLGLVILAIVSAVVTVGAISLATLGLITAKAIIFLLGAVLVGGRFAPWLGHFFSRVHSGVGMKFTLAISIGLILAWVAQAIGLAPIVGAFVAGLVLDPVHFRSFAKPRFVEDLHAALRSAPGDVRERLGKIIDQHAERHVEDLLEPIGHFLVPLFFVVTGMHVRLDAILNLPVLLLALGITAAAIVGKLASGMVAGSVRKWLVGWGMVPRGEVGLIFASMGQSLGVLSDELFSVVVLMVIFSTLLAPPVLAWMLRRETRVFTERTLGRLAPQPQA